MLFIMRCIFSKIGNLRQLDMNVSTEGKLCAHTSVHCTGDACASVPVDINIVAAGRLGR